MPDARRPGSAPSTARRETTTLLRFAVELDDLEFHLLALVRGGVLDRADVHEGAGQEGANAVHRDGEAALDRAADHAGNQGAFFIALSNSFQAAMRLAFSRDSLVEP